MSNTFKPITIALSMLKRTNAGRRAKLPHLWQLFARNCLFHRAPPYWKITSAAEPTFVIVNSKKPVKISGIYAEVLELLEARPQDKVKFVHIVHDSNYGLRLKNGSWNGMVGELLANKADIALGPLSMTTERAKVVDFSPAVLYSGFSVIYQKPKAVRLDFEPSRFVIRGVLYILWLWSTIINIAYTTNIVSVLAMTNTPTPFKNLYEFAHQNEYKPLILKNSGDVEFLKNSKVSWHKKIWKTALASGEELFVNTPTEGRRLIMEKKVAYFGDYLNIMMNIDKPGVSYVKEAEGKAGLHMAFRKDFIYTSLISMRIKQRKCLAKVPCQSALPKCHASTDSDTTGHINGKSKKACFEGFLKASPSIITAISALGIGSEPSKETIQGCVSFLCSLFCKKGIIITQPHTIRWTLFKQQGTDKGVYMLPLIFGAWLEHIKRAHCQAAIWEQDLVLNPVVPDPTKLGWTKQDDRLVPELSKIAPAPAAVVELVRCSYGASNPSAKNKCASGRCSCRVSALACTELCRCEAEADMCQNMNTNIVDPDDIE
ncbi:Glutamate receptor ionotropic, kainate 4 [Nymphon striatum]|nr:Glutamate receptor ionotropic, kainate 4 [Nymphon striatum]